MFRDRKEKKKSKGAEVKNSGHGCTTPRGGDDGGGGRETGGSSSRWNLASCLVHSRGSISVCRVSLSFTKNKCPMAEGKTICRQHCCVIKMSNIFDEYRYPLIAKTQYYQIN